MCMLIIVSTSTKILSSFSIIAIEIVCNNDSLGLFLLYLNFLKRTQFEPRKRNKIFLTFQQLVWCFPHSGRPGILLNSSMFFLLQADESR